jgi:hypothetical protein
MRHRRIKVCGCRTANGSMQGRVDDPEKRWVENIMTMALKMRLRGAWESGS